MLFQRIPGYVTPLLMTIYGHKGSVFLSLRAHHTFPLSEARLTFTFLTFNPHCRLYRFGYNNGFFN